MKFYFCIVLLIFASSAEAEFVWGIWGGASVSTVPFGTLRGNDLKGRGVDLLALHYGRRILSGKNAALFYTVDLLPAVIAEDSEVQNAVRKSVYGFGANPVGFELHFSPAKVHPYAFITGGFLVFQQPTPTPRSTRWNFSTDAGGGLQIAIHHRQAICFGYRLHHISNAGAGESNPSLNTNVLYAGVNFLR